MPSNRVDGSEQPTGAADQGRRRALVVSAWIGVVRAHSVVYKHMERAFRAQGLTPPQFDVLATLHRAEGIAQQDLADRMLVTKGNVSAILRVMEGHGWVERRTDASDARSNLLFLTAASRRLFARVLRDHDRELLALLAPLADEDLRAVTRMMAQLAPLP